MSNNGPQQSDPKPTVHGHPSAEQLRLIFESWPHGIFALDRDGAYIFQNAVDRAQFGNLLGKRAVELQDETAEAENWSDLHRKVLSGETVSLTITNEGEEAATREVEVTISPLGEVQRPIGMLGMVVDRSDAWELEREREVSVRAAEASEARLKRLTDNVPGAIFEFVIDDTGTPNFEYVNSGMAPLLGTTTKAILSDASEAFAYDHPDDAEMVRMSVEKSFETLEPVNITHRINHPSLGLRWNRVQASPSPRQDGGVVWHGCIFDVTDERARSAELERARNRMAALSLSDTLTGLPNRRACDEELARRSSDRSTCSEAATVVRIDLDHFKAVNDTLGHEAGDAVLCRVGECLRKVSGKGDFIARLGGDEFVIILSPGKTIDRAKQLIQKLRGEIADPFFFEGRHCRFDASFGIASTEALPDDVFGLLSSADAALLKAKSLGRGRMMVFTPDLQLQISHTRLRAGQIKAGLDRSEFVPFFQPQIDAATGLLAGFEVLARWQHPEEGCLSPDEFIPVAEQMRVVQDLDRMMFEKALEALDRLQSDGFKIPKLAFNVSAARVHDPEIINSVKSLQTQGTKVAFELIESILLEDETALFANHIDQLKDLNIDIEVDDFGSGRASIIGVLNVAPDTLKIDRRLVLPMFESDNARNLLKAIIEIGQSLAVSITAEGVETIDHALALRQLGCQTLQGYVFGKPMPERDLRTYLATFRPVFPAEQTAV